MRFLVQTLVTILDPVTIVVSLPAACIPRRWRSAIAAACLTGIALAWLAHPIHRIAGIR